MSPNRSELPPIDAEELPPGRDHTASAVGQGALAAPACAAVADREPSANIAAPESERVLQALLYLLVQFSTRGGGVGVVMAIGHHLEMLALRGDVSPSLRATSMQLRHRWQRACAQARAATRRERPSAHWPH